MTRHTTRMKTVVTPVAFLAMAGLVVVGCSSGNEAPTGEEPGGQEVTHIEFAHYQVPGPAVQGEAHFAEELAARSGGSLVVNMHWSEELGKVTEIPNLVSMGAAGMGAVNVHAIPDQFPMASIVTVPVPPSDRESSKDQQARFYSEVLFEQPILGEFQEQNLRPLLGQPLFPLWGISKTEMCNLDDLGGKKIRAVGGYFPKLIEEVGGVPVEVPAADLYPALERGTVDMVITPLGLIDSFKLYETASYVCGPIMMSLGGHVVAMNQELYDSLTVEQQELIDSVAKESQAWAFEEALRLDSELQQSLETEGVTFEDLPADEVRRWFSMGPDFLDEWAAKAGQPGLDVVVERTRDIF